MRMVEIQRPMHWNLAPVHGRHCGPGHESELAPISATDAVCQEHDGCYKSAKDRASELICDARACNAVLELQENGDWNPNWTEKLYNKGMEITFCDDEDHKCLPEDGPDYAAVKAAEKALLEWEPQPQRMKRRRMTHAQKIKAEEQVALVESFQESHSWADLAEEEVPVVLEEELITSVVPQVYKPEVKKEVNKAKRERRRAKRAANKAKKIVAVAEVKAFRRAQQRPRKNGKRKQGPRLPGGQFNSGMGGSRGSAWNPTRRFSDTKGKNGIHLVSGCDLIDKISIASSGANVNGTVINNGAAVTGFQINPLNFANSRLKQIAPLYQKWRPRRLRFIFITALGEFFNGTFLHYYDYDPQSTYTTSNGTEAALQIASAHQDEVPFPVVRNSVCSMKDIKSDSSYWVKQSGDIRTYSCGSYYFFVQDALSLSTGSISYALACGRIFLDYEIEFFQDALDENNTGDPNSSQDPPFGSFQTAANTPASQPTSSYGALAVMGVLRVGKTTWDPDGSRTTIDYGDGDLNWYVDHATGVATDGHLHMYGLKSSTFYSIFVQLRCAAVTTAGTSAWSPLLSGASGITVYINNQASPGSSSVTLQYYAVFQTTSLGGAVLLADNGTTFFTGTATGAWSGHITVIENTLQVAGPTLKGPCHYRKMMESREWNYMRAMNEWDERKACEELDCPLCPQMKAYKFFTNVGPRRIKFDGELIEESESELDSDEETVTHEQPSGFVAEMDSLKIARKVVEEKLKGKDKKGRL